MVAPPLLGGNAAHNAAAAKSATISTRPNGAVPYIAPAPPTIPYSARRAAPLDMNTVEHRGNPMKHDRPPRNRPHNLVEAPTFRPTEEEFTDPMRYIRSISEKASAYGICKIIPPDGWRPDFAIDLERFHFRTRRQELNSVEGGTRANLSYLDQLAKFHKQYGTNLNRFPSVDKRPLDLYKLKKAVEVRGGFEKVCKDKKWAEIGRDLGYSGKIMSSLSTSLKNSYQRWLHPYEEYLRAAKPGVQHQLEFESGGSFQASPAHSPMKRSYSQMDGTRTVRNGSPSMQTKSSIQNISPASYDITSQSGTMPPYEAVPQHSAIPSGLASSVEVSRAPPSTGFTAVNTGGFAAVNAPSGFVAVNSLPQPLVKQESHTAIMTSVPNGHSLFASSGHKSKFAPLAAVSMPTARSGDAGSNALNRTVSHDSLNGESASDGTNGEGDSGSGRRSKRAKKDATPGPAANQQVQMRPSTPRVRPKSLTRKTAEKCDHCGRPENKENIVVCDSCELGFHRHCLDPPMASFPEYDWHCPKCLVGTGEYGFDEGGIYSLKVFQEKATNFKEHHFQDKTGVNPLTNVHKPPTEDEVEREFWRLVESLTETVEVEYGADIHSTTHGSGFPTIEKNPLDPYSRDPWNLNVMPFHEESLFRHIKTDILGMTVPWLYVGMCFSTFCWHNEDHYTYSANYQHFGATKTWYGIPGKDAHAFEDAMRKAVPELFETQPDLLFQLVTLLPPDQLRKSGVEVYALDQHAGEFVITFPQAYHAGFNHDFNFNEAVNFAPADWEPFGEAGVERLQEFRRQPCFSHDELLLTAAAVDTTIKTSKWLAPALERMRDREIHHRTVFRLWHQEASPHEHCRLDTAPLMNQDSQCSMDVKVTNEELQEEDYQCQHCKAYTFLTQFRCHHSGRVSCSLHVREIDCCAESLHQRLLGPNHSLKYRYSNSELETLVQKVVDKASVPELWEARLQKVLEDEARPQLKSLHSLLAEGEKIPYFLPGLRALAKFVKRCDKWVDEANLYLMRKQQNRRKNEKAWRRQSTKGVKHEEKDNEPQLTLDRMKVLLEEGEDLGFSCPQLDSLAEKLESINDWRSEAKILLRTRKSTAEQIDVLLEIGRSYMAAMPELTSLETMYLETKWEEDAHGARVDLSNQSLEQCKTLLERAKELDIRPEHPDVLHFSDNVRQGDFWEGKAKEVMAAEIVHYPQLEALHAQVMEQSFPVNPETLAAMEAILNKNREAQRQILTLYERSQDPDFRRRPHYIEVRDIMKTLEDLNIKPNGTMDLERELRRHEDWIRRGKKLFGKANAPLHILEVHMKVVEEKNNFCFDLNDTFRPPVEPASREASPAEENGILGGDDEKPMFCICRQPEAGLMVACEVCHEWYHSKCLKIARGKMKEFDMFTCPICDWRVKIPRDAARPKLEDLQLWADEVPTLPFQPEEEDLLNRIINKAQAFREFLQQFSHGNQICRTSEEMPSMLFYLRKLEGAEVLLAYETNIFRQDLHKWQPIAPEPPPILDQSLSTRKPRPTKQQKIMREMGIEKVEDLPPHLRTKQAVKRRNTEGSINGSTRPPPLQPAQGQRDSSGPLSGTPRSETPVGVPRQGSTGNPPTNGSASHFSLGRAPASLTHTPPYVHPFSAPGPPYVASSPSPMFSPTGSLPPNGLRDPLVSSRFTGGPSAIASPQDPSFPMFTPGFNMDADDDIRTGLANGGNAVVGPDAEPSSSPHASNVDEMFMQMTNQEDTDTQNDNATAALEHDETSQATEALELIKSASRGVEGDDHQEEGDEDPEKARFEEVFDVKDEGQA